MRFLKYSVHTVIHTKHTPLNTPGSCLLVLRGPAHKSKCLNGAHQALDKLRERWRGEKRSSHHQEAEDRLE